MIFQLDAFTLPVKQDMKLRRVWQVFREDFCVTMKVEPYFTVIQDTEKILLAYAQWTPIKYLASNPFEQKNISKESHESKCP